MVESQRTPYGLARDMILSWAAACTVIAGVTSLYWDERLPHWSAYQYCQYLLVTDHHCEQYNKLTAHRLELLYDKSVAQSIERI